MAIFELLTSCVIPLCVIAFSYIMTARHLLKKLPLTEGTQNPQQKTRNNTAKIVLGLTVVFLISYVPLHIGIVYMSSRVNLDDFFDRDISSVLHLEDNLYNIWIIVDILVSLNSCLNAVALFCTSRAFRRHFKRYLTCCCKVKSPPTDLELRRRN
jgi:hypothetical protein